MKQLIKWVGILVAIILLISLLMPLFNSQSREAFQKGREAGINEVSK